MINLSDSPVLYNEDSIRLLGSIWGQGFMSPGGSNEVDEILSQVAVENMDVLDFGCGAGGVTLYLAKRYAPRSVTGFDVERPAIKLARNRHREQENTGVLDSGEHRPTHLFGTKPLTI